MREAYKNSGPHVAHCSEERKKRKSKVPLAPPHRSNCHMGPRGHGETCGKSRIPPDSTGCKIITLVYIERMPPRTSMEGREDAPTEASSHFACTAKGSNCYEEYNPTRDLATNHR